MLPSSDLGFPSLPTRNGFIPITPQKTLALITWGCTGGSHWQEHSAKYPCKTAGFVPLSSMMKRRLWKIFYLSVPHPHTEEGTRQIQLGVHPEGSTAGAGGVSGKERRRREAREMEVEKELVPAGLAVAPVCLVTDRQKPGEEVWGAALPRFSVYSLHRPSKSPPWPQELRTTMAPRKARFSLWAFIFDSMNFPIQIFRLC